MLSEKTIEQRIYIEGISEEVRDIRSKMKTEKKTVNLKIRWSSAAAIVIISYLMIYMIQLTPQAIIEERCYTNYTRSSQVKEKEPVTLENALEQVNSGDYNEALITLSQLPDSDHKDWFLLNANLGVENFDQVDYYMDKIGNDKEHLYNLQIDNALIYNVYLLKIKGKIL